MSYNYDSDAKNLKKNLNCVHVGTNIIFLPKADSTNNLVKEHAKNNTPEGLVVIADSQTCGRGRMGRFWHSPPETGIYLSILLEPDLNTDQLSLITLVAGVAAIETIKKFCHQSAYLKWPNDILIDGKKICGLLCEMVQNKENSRFIAVGIGINVNQLTEQFPQGLKKTATSLRIINGSTINRMAVIESLLKNIDREYHNLLTDGGHSVIKKWELNTNILGEVVSIKHGSSITTGTAIRIDSLGRLVLLVDNTHEEAFNSGEVSLKSN